MSRSQSRRRSFDSSVRESIIDFKNSLRQSARGGAGLSSANNRDKKKLRDHAKLLASSIETLVGIIESYDAYGEWITAAFPEVRPEHQAKLSRFGPHIPNSLGDLSSALAAAFNIGVLAIDSPLFRQLEKNRKAAHARDTRTTKSRQRKREIRALAQRILDDYPSWKPPRIAAEISATSGINLKTNSIEKIVRKMMPQLTGVKSIPT
jgi:hypothetical protein